jgi:hypothetical protein
MEETERGECLPETEAAIGYMARSMRRDLQISRTQSGTTTGLD